MDRSPSQRSINAAESADQTLINDNLIATYHKQVLPVYRSTLSCDWPRQIDPCLGTLNGLEIDQLPQWQEAIAPLSGDPILMQTLAGQLLQQGRQGEGLAIYRHLLEEEPDNAQRLHNLAGALLIAGNAEEAERRWRQALDLDSTWPEPRLALGQLKLDQDELNQAADYFLSVDPEGNYGYARALGLALIKAKRDRESVTRQSLAELELLIDQAKESAERFMRLLRTMAISGYLEEAIQLLPQAPDPDVAWGWDFEELRLLNLAAEMDRRIDRAKSLLESYPENAEICLNVGIVIADSDPNLAAKLYQQAIAIQPTLFEAWANLAVVYGTLLEPDLALDAHIHAIQLNPLSLAQLNLGNFFCDLPDMAAAERCYRNTILLCPYLSEAWMSLGNALHAQRHQGPDLVALRKGYDLDPSSLATKLSLGLALLMHEDYDEGWLLYEARLSHQRALYWPKGLDKWDGLSEIDELLIVAEQGIGDVVQFMRYSILLTIGISRVTILAEPKFDRLLTHYGGFAAVHSVSEPYRVMEKSAWYPMASLLGLLGIRSDAVILSMPYLGVDPESGQRWNRILASEDQTPLIGLNWQGNPHTEDSFFKGRSFPLETYAPLAECEGIRFVSLQKGPGSEQLESCSFRHRFVDAQGEVDEAWDFIETLSILQACDLVITSDTSVAHLAGALGRPTWVLLKFMPDWRWGLEGEESPWYPSMRLFRQERPDDWGPVMDRVVAALQTWQPQSSIVAENNQSF